MTLYRQLLIFMICLFVFMLTGLSIEKLENTRNFLEVQLATHAQDTATFLGLSLTHVVTEGDISAADAMLNAVFDRGYYKSIDLTDMNGGSIIEKTLKVQVTGVPQWFVDVIPLETPSAEATIMSGWTQTGKVLVSSHPGYAYATLWGAAVRLVVFFFAVGVGVSLLGAVILRIIFKPLKKVEQQADAICRKDYVIQEELPKTRELRRVVESMNRLTAHVRERFAEQASLAEKLRQKTYTDAVTGLGNRRYISNQVASALEREDGEEQGAFLLVQLENLQEINEQHGYERGDVVLKKVAELIRNASEKHREAAYGRLAGGSFAIYLPGLNYGDTEQFTEVLIQEIRRLAVAEGLNSENLAHLGGAVYENIRPNLSTLLSEADTALQAARSKGANNCMVNSCQPGEDVEARGKTWWKNTMDEVLANKTVLLFSQPVVNRKDTSQVLHNEILSRIALNTKEIVSAGVFVPFAEQMELISRFDQIVMEQILREVVQPGSLKNIAVNISPTSLRDASFVAWLVAQLRNAEENRVKVVFEFSEFGAVQYLETLKTFSEKVRLLGHGIALDHFGQSFSNFGYLQSLKPDYVKIDRTFTKDLLTDQGDSEFFIESLCGVAHSLDIKVIAEGIEAAEQFDKLFETHVDGMQGYYFFRPEKINE